MRAARRDDDSAARSRQGAPAECAAGTSGVPVTATNGAESGANRAATGPGGPGGNDGDGANPYRHRRSRAECRTARGQIRCWTEVTQSVAGSTVIDRSSRPSSTMTARSTILFAGVGWNSTSTVQSSLTR